MELTKMNGIDEKEKTDQPNEYLDKFQLAKMLNCSVKSVMNWTTSRRLPVVRCGRLVRYPRIEIERKLLNGQLLS